jgi:hypothetical protein
MAFGIFCGHWDILWSFVIVSPILVCGIMKNLATLLSSAGFQTVLHKTVKKFSLIANVEIHSVGIKQ